MGGPQTSRGGGRGGNVNIDDVCRLILMNKLILVILVLSFDQQVIPVQCWSTRPVTAGPTVDCVVSLGDALG